jgi:hypothetical protein
MAFRYGLPPQAATNMEMEELVVTGQVLETEQAMEMEQNMELDGDEFEYLGELEFEDLECDIDDDLGLIDARTGSTVIFDYATTEHFCIVDSLVRLHKPFSLGIAQ